MAKSHAFLYNCLENIDHAIIYAAIVNSNLRFNKEGYFHAFLFSTRCAINELENKNFVLVSYIETLVEV